MKKIFVALVLLVLVCFSSCITTLHPVASADTIVTDKRLEGKWSAGKDVFNIAPLPGFTFEKDNSTFRIDNADKDSAFYSKFYMIYFTKKNVEYYMTGSLSKIKGNYFADIMSLGMIDPARKNENNEFEFNFNYLSTFSVVKLEFVNDRTLKMKPLNGDYIRQQIEAGRVRLKHDEDKLFNRVLITASSFELRQFLEKYAGDERLYDAGKEVTLTKPQ